MKGDLRGWGAVLGTVATVLTGGWVPGGVRGRMVRTVLAGLVLGLGSVAIGGSLVHASERDGLAGFFEMLFGGGRRDAELRAVPQPTRYNTLPPRRLDRIHRHVVRTPRPESFAYPVVERRRRRLVKAAAAPVPGRLGDRTVCVRRCDGYLFPLGNLRDSADLPLHASACAAACPNAATEVYTLAAGETALDHAVSAGGLPYRASAVANVFRQRRVADCACQPAGRAIHAALETDQTLRRGDVIATRTSAQVVTRIDGGQVDLQDYRRAAIGRTRVRAVEARVGTIRREAAARSFRQQVRAAEGSPVVQMAGAGDEFPSPSGPGRMTPRVVVPSPYLR